MVTKTAKSHDRATEPTHVEAFGRGRWFAALLATLSMFGLGIDALLEMGVAAGVFYVVVVAVTVFRPGMRVTVAAAVGTSGLAAIGYFLSPPGGELWKALANRLIALFAIGVTAALVWHHKRLTSQRERGQAVLARSEEQFRQMVEASPIGMLVVDARGRIALANGEAERLFGYARGELVGQPVEMLIPARHAPAHVRQRETFAADITARRMAGGREVAGLDRHGRELPLEVGLAHVHQRGGDAVLVTLADIGDRQRLERARAAHLLAQGIVEAEDEQRKRFAREIHDALGQDVTALRLDIGWVARQLVDAPESLRARVQAIKELANRTIDDVRRLSAELHPKILDDLGLLAAVRWQVADFEKRSGLSCLLALPDAGVPLSEQRNTVVFRVLQESLTNIARHARARSVSVALRLEAQGDTVLEVRDDGRGLDPAHPKRSGALGLRGMRERAQLCGGSLVVDGASGAGTTVTLRLPPEPAESQAEGDRRTARPVDAPSTTRELR